ncbi:MAG: 4-(cytidine 5'-diphospho)-2-C-methyl-D-erythritol kinase [Sphingomonadaceae bacterium]
MTLCEIAYAKINLALHVRRRRVDGYHDLESLFAFANDGDRLSATPASTLSLSLSGEFSAGLSVDGDNLVMRAAAALRSMCGVGEGAALHLEKRLPIASGIGGGSADAAAALRLLARMWGIAPAHPALNQVARSLGADVPACLVSQTIWGEGRGDELTPITVAGLSGTPLLLVNPRLPLATGPVFAAWDGVDRGPLAPHDFMNGRNDLSASAIALQPAIAPLLEALAAMPSTILARMSGSGATCFALFENEEGRDAAAAQFRDEWCLSTRIK